MSNLKAIKRENLTTGSTNRLRADGFIPAILYGGNNPNQNISISKKEISNIISSDTFLSKVLEIEVDGKKEKVIPRDVSYHVHKRGGVLNIVRRKVELKCPAETIPDEIIVDLAGTDIGTSIKISSVKLPENVFPTITDRDFVVATVAAPTVIKEPEKPAEETPSEGTEGETQVEGAEATTKDGEAAKKDDKSKEAAVEKKTEDKKTTDKKPADKK